MIQGRTIGSDEGALALHHQLARCIDALNELTSVLPKRSVTFALAGWGLWVCAENIWNRRMKPGDALETNRVGNGTDNADIAEPVWGAIDGIRSGAVVGWVRTDGRRAVPAVVELFVNGVSASLGRANRPLDDVFGGRFGFSIHLPEHVCPGDQLEVRFANTGQALAGSPLVSDCYACSPPHLRGAVERVEGLVLVGWALDQRNPAAQVGVVALHQGREIGRARANLFRGDLADGGIEGNHAFRLSLPLSFGNGQPHGVDVLFDLEDGRFLIGSIEVLVHPKGPVILARFIAMQAERMSAPAIVAGARVLETYFRQQERQRPCSLDFRDYATWSAFFQAPPPDPARVSAGTVFVAVIDGTVTGGEGLSEPLMKTVWSLRAQSLPPRRVAVLVQDAAQADAVRLLGSDLILVHAPSAVQALAALMPEMDAYLVPLAAGDVLHSDCLRHFATVAGWADIVYADSDVANVSPAEVPPHFKPDWNYDLFLSGNYMSPAWAVHRRTLNPALGLAEWADLAYCAVEQSRQGAIVHIPYVLGSQAAVPVTASGEEPMCALARHLQRAGHTATIQSGNNPAVPYRVSWSPAPVRPTLSLIVPTRDRVELLSQCLDSLRNVLQTGRVECLIVDNGSEQLDTLRYLQQAAGIDGVRIIQYPGPFNYSALNNMAAQQAKGDLLGFINNDVVIPPQVQRHWLDEIFGYFQRRDVGGVGLKLLYDDGFVQHGGVILGTNGLADHAFRRLRHDEAGYWGRAVKAQQLSAVTAAALFVRRSQFFEVGGFNERDLPVAFNDVDLCLKLRHRGLAIVWTPHVWAFHLESASRGTDITPRKHDRMERESAYLRRQWEKVLDCDPFYNPNLCGDGDPFGGLALPPRRAFLPQQGL